MTASARLPTSSPPARWVERLERASAELGVFIEDFEEEFVSFGAALETCMARAGAAADAANRAVAGALHQTIEATADEFEDRLRALEHGADDGQQFMEDVRQRIGEILGALQETTVLERRFRSAVRALRALSVATLVESARVDTDRAEFIGLAGRVHALAGSIDERFREVKTRSEDLGQRVEESLDAVQEAERVQTDRLQWAVGELRSGFAKLGETARHSARLAEQIELRARQVADRVGGIVVSLQAQDRTRQRLEHIRDSLDDLCHRFSASPGGTDPFAVASIVVPLQEQQLREARRDFDQAVASLVSDLGELGSIVESITADISGNDGSTRTDTTRFLQGLAETVRQVAASVGETVKRNETTASLLHHSAEEASAMGRFVDEIETIGDELGLIAINAVVHASRVGARGRALGAVAQEIQAATLAARQHTADLSRFLRQIRDSAEGLGTVAGDYARQSRKRVEQVGDRMEQMVGNLRTADAKLKEGLAVVLREGTGLGEELRTAARDLTVHRRLQVIEEQVARTLQAITDDVAAAGAEAAPLPANVLAELETRYTMAPQREVHRSNLALACEPGTTGASDDNVELF